MASKTEPLVCCVCLTADRQEFTARAARCFGAQTYGNKHMLIFDTGAKSFDLQWYPNNITVATAEPFRGHTIGSLRNAANALLPKSEIIAHWDSDDWSHPSRLTEQVAFLQSSGAEAVGFNEMLFAREDKIFKQRDDGPPAIRAWLYTHGGSKPYALGTSLCYWRKTWEARPFLDGPKNPEATSEYQHWNVNAVRLASCSSIPPKELLHISDAGEPRMIARIHGGNTSAAYSLERKIAEGSREWYRVPQWDARVRELLK